ncbi:MAG TPA: hypothetical protein VIG41_09055 [Micrococcaceae bacterium]
MRRSKRTVLFLAAAASVALALGGCSSADSSRAGAASSAGAGASGSAASGSAGSAPTSGPWALDFQGSGDRIHAAGLQILTAEGTAEHYHAHLDVFVNGSAETVPADIGFVVDASGQATGISALHTHDTSGVLHIEAPTAGQKYTLGQALTEWGVLGQGGSIGGQTDSGAAAWQVYINGVKQTGKVTAVQLAAHQEIALVYGTDPAQIPASYAFPAGE